MTKFLIVDALCLYYHESCDLGYELSWTYAMNLIALTYAHHMFV